MCSSKVWILLAISLLAVTICLFLIGKYRLKNSKDRRNYYDFTRIQIPVEYVWNVVMSQGKEF